VYLIPNIPGSYVIMGELPGNVYVDVGAFGHFEMKTGRYFYCGNARGSGGLQARIMRHFKDEKKNFWHFDYVRPHLNLLCVWWCDARVSECDFCRHIGRVNNASHPILGFGASDCENDCPSHLVYAATSATWQAIFSTLQEKLTDYSEIESYGNLLESSKNITGAA